MTHTIFRSTLIAAVACLISLPPVFASDVARQVTSLTESGSAKEALMLAQQHLQEMEGDPSFDFAYGLAAANAGQPSRAVFALERVLLQQPDNIRARLELARGYFLLEQYASARIEFNRVLDASPPKNVQDNVSRYLDIIRLREGRYKTTSSYYVEFGSGYDDNINSALDDGDLGAIQIPDTSLATDDYFLNLEAGLNITHPVQPGLSLVGGIAAQHQANLDAYNFNRSSLDLNAGLSYLQNRDNFRLLAQGQKYLVAGDEYRNLLGLTGEWRHSYQSGTMINAYAQGLELEYPYNKLRDSRQYTLGVGGMKTQAWKYRPLIFGSLFMASERATSDSPEAEILTDRNMLGGRLGVQLTLAPAVSSDFAIQYLNSSYQVMDPMFQKKREDNYTKMTLGATWLFRKHWSARAALTHHKNDSNIEIHNYDGNRVDLTFRYEF